MRTNTSKGYKEIIGKKRNQRHKESLRLYAWVDHFRHWPVAIILIATIFFFRFAPFCEPALNKVTRMLNLSSLFSKFLVSSHWYLSLSSSFFVSFLASRGLGLTLHSLLSVWCSLSGLVWSGLVWSGLIWSALVLVSSDCCACACARTLRHLSYFGLVACIIFVCYSVVNFYFLVFFVLSIMLLVYVQICQINCDMF